MNSHRERRGLLLTLLLALPNGPLPAADRPNILWITAEDMSPNLGCYGDSYATTPNLDRFARESVRYTRAFATAPVCSPARSTLITGCHATSLGTQRLRSHFPIPSFIKGFPEYLREAGYFTSNNVKTDYNIADEEEFIRSTWIQNSPRAHWRQRGKDKQFFSVFNLMTTHQSRANVWPWEQFEKEIASQLTAAERHDPASAPIWPYYPDTTLVRRTVARYYDCITVMDKQVGELLGQLEQDGLAEDTIVFFYSDHGMGMPRGKRLLHDTGMHVPLMIRFPEKWKQLAPAAPGETVERLVSFVDFAPTVLSLTGLEIPDYMQGLAFLGNRTARGREFVFGARDRVDEAFDLSRSARDDRYLLIRNYMSHYSWMAPERYSDNADMRREMKRLARADQLDAAQLTYGARFKDPVEFYDTQVDPHQTNNLASTMAELSAERLPGFNKLSTALDRWEAQTLDLGFIPEPVMWRLIEEEETTPWELFRTGARRPFLPFADIEVIRKETAETTFSIAPEDSESGRYWNAVNLNRAAQLSRVDKEPLEQGLKDESALVRIECAAGLLSLGWNADAISALTKELASPSVETRLHAVRALELAGEVALTARQAIVKARDEASQRLSEHPCWMFIEFSADAALDNFAARETLKN